MTIVLFATMSPTIAGQFSRIIDLAVILVVIPYIYASVAVVKVVFDHKLPRRTFLTYKWIAIAAVAQSPDPPEYEMTAVTGPDHDRMFECAVYHNGVELGRGKGKSKKAAESEAATAALGRLRERRPTSKKS